MKRHAIIKPCRKKDFDPDRPASKQKVCLYSKKDPGKLLGRHPSEESARKQEIAIQINKSGSRVAMRRRVRLGDEPSEKLVKKWMLQEVYRDPNDWVDSGMEPLYTQLAEAAALFFDVDHWLDDDHHPVWDWSIAVLDQVFEEEAESAYEPYLDKTDRSLLKREYSAVYIDNTDVTPHVRGPIRVREAVSRDPYERAVERMNDASCRKGIFGGFQALRNRIKAIRNPDKLEGVEILVEELSAEVEETQRVLESTFRKVG